MNLNELAKEISRLEGGKREVNIAQIKEILKCLGHLLYYDCSADEAMDLCNKLIKNGKKWAGKK